VAINCRYEFSQNFKTIPIDAIRSKNINEVTEEEAAEEAMSNP